MGAECLLLNCSGRGEDLIHSQLIYFHSHCLEPVVPIKKQGERNGKAGQKVGGLDHSAPGTPPIKGSIILEQGHLVADGLLSAVKAWHVASRHRSALSNGKVIITKTSGKSRGGREGQLPGCVLNPNSQKRILNFCPLESSVALSLEEEWILIHF